MRYHRNFLLISLVSSVSSLIHVASFPWHHETAESAVREQLWDCLYLPMLELNVQTLTKEFYQTVNPAGDTVYQLFTDVQLRLSKRCHASKLSPLKVS